MTRKELAAALSENMLFPAQESAEVVDLFFEVISEGLGRGEKIKIHGFGNFNVREKAARKGRNPKTGERMEISARRVVTFRPSALLREALNRGAK